MHTFLIEGFSVYKVRLIVRIKSFRFFAFFLVNLAFFLHFVIIPSCLLALNIISFIAFFFFLAF